MASFSYTLLEQQFDISLDLPTDLRQAFAVAPRSFSYTGSLPRDWKTRYYGQFLGHAADRLMVEAVLNALRKSANSSDPDTLAAHAIAWVQQAIAYDWQTAYDLRNSHIRYPSETVLDGHGVCADKTVLLAALLQRLGYGVAMLTWERANHMALGLQVPAGHGNFSQAGIAYAMVETTAAAPIGNIPKRYAGGTTLVGSPELTPMPGGSGVYAAIVAEKQAAAALAKEYGRDYLDLPPAQQAIYRELHPLQAQIQASEKQLRGCQGSLPPDKYAACKALHEHHNALVERYNALVAEFNAAGA